MARPTEAYTSSNQLAGQRLRLAEWLLGRGWPLRYDAGVNGERRPEDVFTPRTIVSREMFARRNEPDIDGMPGLQDRLQDALMDVGGQVLLFGDTGVGKSSLLRYAAEDAGLMPIVIGCTSVQSFDDLMHAALSQMVDVEEIKRTETSTVGGEASGEGKVEFLITVKGMIKGERTKGSEFRVIQKSPIDATFAAMLEGHYDLLVLDNFQNVKSIDTRRAISQLLELASDRADNQRNIKVVIIGIADDAPSLLGGSGSFRRRTTEIGVPRMPDDEIWEILTRGFRLLDLEVPEPRIQELVYSSDGFPYFAHILGLHVARTARRAGERMVDSSMVELALRRSVNEVDKSYATRVRRAYEAGGEVQPRRRILQLLSRSDQREWRSGEVVTAWAATYGARTDYAFLHVALAQLTGTEFGSILRRSGTPRKYVYQFSDPLLRPYLRLTSAGASG